MLYLYLRWESNPQKPFGLPPLKRLRLNQLRHEGIYIMVFAFQAILWRTIPMISQYALRTTYCCLMSVFTLNTFAVGLEPTFSHQSNLCSSGGSRTHTPSRTLVFETSLFYQFQHRAIYGCCSTKKSSPASNRPSLYVFIDLALAVGFCNAKPQLLSSINLTRLGIHLV